MIRIADRERHEKAVAIVVDRGRVASSPSFSALCPAGGPWAMTRRGPWHCQSDVTRTLPP